MFCLEWKKGCDGEELQMVATDGGLIERKNDENEQEFTSDNDHESKDHVPLIEGSFIRKKARKYAPPIFTQQDEIILLQEMLKFKEKEGDDDLKMNWVKFHRFVKEKLMNEFSPKQVSEKVQRSKQKMERVMKRKYVVNDLEGNKALIFELSKKLWATGQKRERSTPYVSPGTPLDPTHYPSLYALFKNIDSSGWSKNIGDAWTLIGSEAAEKLEIQQSMIVENEISLNKQRINFNLEVGRLVGEQIKWTVEIAAFGIYSCSSMELFDYA